MGDRWTSQAGLLHHPARFSALRRRAQVRRWERRREPYAGIDVVRDCTPGADHEFLSHDLRRARGTMALTAREIVRRTVEAVT